MGRRPHAPRGARPRQRAELAEALEQALQQTRVLIDLGACTFVDSTVIKRLVSAHAQQVRAGGRLELVIPPDAPMVERLARLIRLDEVMRIHESREAGIASIQGDE